MAFGPFAWREMLKKKIHEVVLSVIVSELLGIVDGKFRDFILSEAILLKIDTLVNPEMIDEIKTLSYVSL